MADESKQENDMPDAALPAPARTPQRERGREEAPLPSFMPIGFAVLAGALILFAGISLVIAARAAHARRLEAETSLHSAAVFAASDVEAHLALMMERAHRFAAVPGEPDKNRSLHRLASAPDPLVSAVRIIPQGKDAAPSLQIADGDSTVTLTFPATDDATGPAVVATLAPDWVGTALANGKLSDAIAVLAVGPDGRIVGKSGSAKILAAISPNNRVPFDLFASADASGLSKGGATIWRGTDGTPLIVTTAPLDPGMTMVAAARVAPGLAGWDHRMGPFIALGGVPIALGGTLLALMWAQGNQLAEAERRRRASDDVLNLAVTSSSCGFWDWDVSGGRIFWSGPLLALAGRPSRGTWLTVGESHQLLQPADVARLARLHDYFAHGAEALDTTLHLQDLNGRTIWLEGRLRPWHGDPSRIVGMFIDVTRFAEAKNEAERQAREIFAAIQKHDVNVAAAMLDPKGSAQLITAMAENEKSRRELAELSQRYAAERTRAEEANRAKTEFLANMSHELKTPLNAIIGFSEIMNNELYGAIGDERYRGYASAIYDSGRQLAHLIDDILEMSKIEAGRVALNAEDLDLEGLVGECIRLIEPRARDAGVAVENLVVNPPIAVGDRRATKRILMNLLTNAVKFTPRGGNIAIECESEPKTVTILVGDTGIGIPQDDLERILAPFEQVEQHSSRSHRGAGLGLAISKALSEMQGGALKIESTQGVGTKAYLVLPRERQNVAHAG